MTMLNMGIIKSGLGGKHHTHTHRVRQLDSSVCVCVCACNVKCSHFPLKLVIRNAAASEVHSHFVVGRERE